MAGPVFLLPGTDLADIAAAVRAELAPELARINDSLDADVSSRATPEDVTVTVPTKVEGGVQ